MGWGSAGWAYGVCRVLGWVGAAGDRAGPGPGRARLAAWGQLGRGGGPGWVRGWGGVVWGGMRWWWWDVVVGRWIPSSAQASSWLVSCICFFETGDIVAFVSFLLYIVAHTALLASANCL